MLVLFRLLVLGLVSLMVVNAAVAKEEPAVVVVVMDPLAAPLSCPCVKGYAQRDYDKLGLFLEEKLGRKVVVKFGESLDKGLVEIESGRADIVIGKRSVVIADGARLGQKLIPFADLSGKDGGTTQRGLIVVRSDDPAKTVEDLRDYRLILGPAECDEKNGAARELLAKHGVTIAKDAPISAACSDGAAEVVDTGAKVKVAAVISSYARPLLEGCGTIKKGDLRVVGETQDIPFVSAFVEDGLDGKLKESIRAALLEVRTQPLLRLALESKVGFVAIEVGQKPANTKPAATQPATAVPSTKATSATKVPGFEGNGDWPSWRGKDRDAVVAYLPEKLPTAVKWSWKKTLLNQGLGGAAVAQGVAIVGDRDTSDEFDVFHAVKAATGERLWSFRYAAPGRLDYGNSPRATPLIDGEFVYLLGAFGHLHCVRLADGKVVWKKHLRQEFQAEDELVWGACSSPLMVDGKLIVNPGGQNASLVALHPQTGDVIWKCPGAPSAFASFVVAEIGQRKQLVGYDKVSSGGWDVSTGERLWSVLPRSPGDFNVPTPLVVGDKVLFTSENNGTRLLGFEKNGEAKELAASSACAPDMHTPVLAGDRIFAVNKNKVFCFAANDLRLLWSATDRSLQGHVSLIASQDRVLLQTQKGELVLLDAKADKLSILSRLPLFEEEVSIYTHPVLVGEHLYIRGPGHLFCLRLNMPVES